MQKNSKVVRNLTTIPNGQVKAVLRGGTFHRVKVILQQEQDYIEHCGLIYKVTKQKDSSGRIICTWSRSYSDPDLTSSL
jgi:hypothetical protein